MISPNYREFNRFWDYFFEAIGHATKIWIIDLIQFGVKHQRRSNDPPITLSTPTTRSTNGGSTGGDSILLIGDKVFLAAAATACHKPPNHGIPHKSQKWIYKIKTLQIDQFIFSNCTSNVSQIR